MSIYKPQKERVSEKLQTIFQTAREKGIEISFSSLLSQMSILGFKKEVVKELVRDYSNVGDIYLNEETDIIGFTK